MKEKRNITIIDKKQIPSDEPARQYYFMDIAKKYVAELDISRSTVFRDYAKIKKVTGAVYDKKTSTWTL